MDTLATDDERPLRRRSTSTTRILLVEDEHVVRSFLTRLLEETGYSVVPASDGAEALQIAGGDLKGFDLVISDVRMPRLNGWQLGQILRQRRPSLPVLYMSGYDQEPHVIESTAFLRKPFEPTELLRRVAQLLSST